MSRYIHISEEYYGSEGVFNNYDDSRLQQYNQLYSPYYVNYMCTNYVW
jgi:hypothetical protein